jgi:hypothetical protein
MPKSRAKTKAGKQKAVAKDMKRFKAGTLKSGSGKRVTSKRQARAISLRQAGVPKKGGRKK